jgi:plastocyanin
MSLGLVALAQVSPEAVQATSPTFNATIVDNAYQPTQINITTGTQVIWTYSSTGRVQHTVSSTPNTNTTQGGTPLISSGAMNPGQSFSYIFYKHGSYPIQCGFHPFMNELVNVTGSDIQAPSQRTVTPAIDYTPYIIGGIVAVAIAIASVALFLRRRVRKTGSNSGVRPT